MDNKVKLTAWSGLLQVVLRLTGPVLLGCRASVMFCWSCRPDALLSFRSDRSCGYPALPSKAVWTNSAASPKAAPQAQRSALLFLESV
jgi:hypothetical protein